MPLEGCWVILYHFGFLLSLRGTAGDRDTNVPRGIAGHRQEDRTVFG
jgi:hypothetical protein